VGGGGGKGGGGDRVVLKGRWVPDGGYWCVPLGIGQGVG